jgi:hypothetical protein
MPSRLERTEGEDGQQSEDDAPVDELHGRLNAICRMTRNASRVNGANGSGRGAVVIAS